MFPIIELHRIITDKLEAFNGTELGGGLRVCCVLPMSRTPAKFLSRAETGSHVTRSGSKTPGRAAVQPVPSCESRVPTRGSRVPSPEPWLSSP
jgi:hypothetical protein